ncbi:MAG: 50S ribosomal protein L15 [Deltaproteobacteria bacterium]|nr:50S ribosomal protein L15 [Deltaproteobacteria bacterium]
MLLDRLKAPYGAFQNHKRVGRGPGSGNGTYAGRGMKGQKSRSGGKIAPYFEGGQMPLQRRLPKSGFTNIFRKKIAILNIQDLEKWDLGSLEVNLETLKKNKRVPLQSQVLRVLGTGDLKKKLTIKANHFTKSAKVQIEKAGGKVEVI